MRSSASSERLGSTRTSHHSTNGGTRTLEPAPAVCSNDQHRLDERSNWQFAAPVRWLRLVFVVVPLLCCGRTEPLSETIGVDAGRADTGVRDAGMTSRDAGAPTSCTNAPGPQLGRRCQRTLRLDSLSRSSALCFVDVRIDLAEEGTLEWECEQATGRAEVRFSRARFTGVVSGNQLDVCFGSEFDWSDRCRWSSAQALRGSLSEPTLQLTYAEAPLTGSGCQTPCGASGVVTLLAP